MTKITVVGPLEADSFADNLLDAGTRLGHEMIGVGTALPITLPGKVGTLSGILAERVPKMTTYLQRKIVEEVLEFNPEVLIVVDRRVTSESLLKIRSHGVKTALWFPDAVSNLGRHDILLAGYDRLFFKNPILVNQLFNVYGLPAKYLPEGANPRWHYPIGEYGTEIALTVAGNLHPARALLLDRLILEGVPLRIFGAPMPDWINLPRVRDAHEGKAITREEKSKIFRNSTAVLNNLHPAEFAGANCRLFEATAAGAVVLTEPRPGMDNLFEFGREVITFDSFEQLKASFIQLLENPDVGKEIADRAAARALLDHTWDIRIEQLLASI